MFNRHTRYAAGLASLIGAGAAGLAMAAGGDGAGEGPVRCAIETASAGGMLTLEGVVQADVAVSGSYRFRVVGTGGGGSSNVQQGGTFMAGPDAPATLGTVMLGGGGDYDATLEVMADGMTVTCQERVGGAI